MDEVAVEMVEERVHRELPTVQVEVGGRKAREAEEEELQPCHRREEQ